MDSGQGVVFGVGSSKNRRMTYKLVADSADGLWCALYLSQFYNAAHFNVYDGDHGLVGQGSLSPGHREVFDIGRLNSTE